MPPECRQALGRGSALPVAAAPRIGGLACTLALALAGIGSAGAEPVVREGRVLAVNNGQELLVAFGDDGERVRLACLQAPRPEQQPHADEATRALGGIVSADDAVTTELRARDVFGRRVAVVRHRGQDLGARLVRQGRVFAYDGYLGRCDDLGYEDLQQEARQARRGIWREDPAGIERPWNLLERSGGGQEP